MTRGFVITIAAAATAACAGQGGIAVRPLSTPLAAGQRSVPFRVAEANGQFALGNVALALESYRKALRDDPASVDAMVGMAASYDKMGRFDVSRRHYEAALAIEPANREVLNRLAASLLQQGRTAEADAIGQEIASRGKMADAITARPAAVVAAPVPLTAAPAMPTLAPTATSVAAPAPAARSVEIEPAVTAMAIAPVGASVTLALPVARPITAVTIPLPVARTAEVPVKVVNSRVAPLAQREPAPVIAGGPRLERMSLGEVALVTSRAAPTALMPRSFIGALMPSKPQVAPLARPTVTLASLSRPAPLLVLNAARSQGLAARTRRYLNGQGFAGAMIGDARRVRATTVIIAPAADRLRARRIARALGILTRPVEGKRLTLVLGRDAAARRILAS